mgnify:CR=1 FL=1
MQLENQEKMYDNITSGTYVYRYISGGYEYIIDLIKMEQTNLRTTKVRKILIQ